MRFQIQHITLIVPVGSVELAGIFILEWNDFVRGKSHKDRNGFVRKVHIKIGFVRNVHK